MHDAPSHPFFGRPAWPGCLWDREFRGQRAQRTVPLSSHVQIRCPRVSDKPRGGRSGGSHQCSRNFGAQNSRGSAAGRAEQPCPCAQGLLWGSRTAPRTEPRTGACRSWTRGEERLEAGRSFSPGLAVRFRGLCESVDIITLVVEIGCRRRLGTGTPVRCGDGGRCGPALPGTGSRLLDTYQDPAAAPAGSAGSLFSSASLPSRLRAPTCRFPALGVP